MFIKGANNSGADYIIHFFMHQIKGHSNVVCSTDSAIEDYLRFNT